MSENLYKCPKCGEDLYYLYDDMDNWGSEGSGKSVEIKDLGKVTDSYTGAEGRTWLAKIKCPKDGSIIEVEDSSI